MGPANDPWTGPRIWKTPRAIPDAMTCGHQITTSAAIPSPSSRTSGRRSRPALVRPASWPAWSSISGWDSTCGQPPPTVSTTVVSANAIVYDSQLDLMPSGSPSRATSNQRCRGRMFSLTYSNHESSPLASPGDCWCGWPGRPSWAGSACRLDHGRDVLIMVACVRSAAARRWLRLVCCPGPGDRSAAGRERRAGSAPGQAGADRLPQLGEHVAAAVQRRCAAGPWQAGRRAARARRGAAEAGQAAGCAGSLAGLGGCPR